MNIKEKIMKNANKNKLGIEVYVANYAPNHYPYKGVENIHTDTHQFLDIGLGGLDCDAIQDYSIVSAKQYNRTVNANCCESDTDDVIDYDADYMLLVTLDPELWHKEN